ncbi:MAG TPA: DUF262 domain-containing protein, partial [Corynebacterium sp.]|nr:DUF262 domain-containing protein [Corynebacterium sp.]
MAFTTPSYSLTDLFARIDHGELQLPDFQRSFSWDADQIRSLIVTVLRGYPVGAFLALDTRNEPMRFKPRAVVGAPDTGQDPGLLLLDGQQRLTSLYQSFQSPGLVETVDFRSKRIRRRYLVDVKKAVEEEIMPDEAVFSVDETGQVTSHFGPRLDYRLDSWEACVAAGSIPVASLLTKESTGLLFEMAAEADPGFLDQVKAFQYTIATPLSAYDIPMIRLGRETARAGVGSIFAQANQMGLQMDVFELLTAVFATEDPDFSLADSWKKTRAILREHPALDGIGRTEFLTAVSLLVTGRTGHSRGQREDIVNLRLSDYTQAVDQLRDGFLKAAEFLAQRCILSTEQMPYTAQIVPLAVILALLDETPGALSEGSGLNRLNQWFWSGVFGELYGSAAVTIRAGRDVDEVAAWVREQDAPVPKTVADAVFTESRLLSIDENSGVWQGIYALLMGRGARDWRTGRRFDRWSYAELDPDFAPVFPRQWCRENEIDQVLADSILNRTPMSKRTEVVITGYDPARYLVRVQSKSLMENDEFRATLA